MLFFIKNLIRIVSSFGLFLFLIINRKEASSMNKIISRKRTLQIIVILCILGVTIYGLRFIDFKQVLQQVEKLPFFLKSITMILFIMLQVVFALFRGTAGAGKWVFIWKFLWNIALFSWFLSWYFLCLLSCKVF